MVTATYIELRGLGFRIIEGSPSHKGFPERMEWEEPNINTQMPARILMEHMKGNEYIFSSARDAGGVGYTQENIELFDNFSIPQIIELLS